MVETSESLSLSTRTKDAAKTMPFPNISDSATFHLGVDHICKVDRKLRSLIKKHGPFEFACEGDPFESLVEAVISQQLNGAAAESIFAKLKTSLEGEELTAHSLIALPIAKFRKAGVSPQKIRYLKDLSQRVVNGSLRLEELWKMSDEEVISILDEVKGIGPWTAHMFLLFTLGRADILPVDDLGIQDSMRKVYALRKRPNRERIEELAKAWHPYCSIASLYLWRTKDTA
ncbi:MAG TPA: DNA-3-methyladenine glycosylase [Candidatus Acidoferrales bacterium]|nr:DNA-3-methyladenine glycosylase [Candidatus Acidoferrales bacterium]